MQHHQELYKVLPKKLCEAMQYIHKYNENRELRPFDKKFV